ncbi:MAG: class I SAM-dependent methyltransferase [Chloroflexi bacterium]|nr:class I SAM-dependent methyltransferase [Chloroflexota bacterium]
MAQIVPDRASFKDPDAHVFSYHGRIYRSFNQRGAQQFRAFAQSGLLDIFTQRGWLISSHPVAEGKLQDLQGEEAQSALVLEHPLIPFLSYCYCWPFDMLRSAAILHLELLRECLAKGFILKDATPYNIQFWGPNPVFIDVASFKPWQEGQGWKAYAQFCRLFLNPLLLESATGVHFQPWLRGSLEGIAPSELSGLTPFLHKLRKGVFLDVVAQAWLERKVAKGSASLERLISSAPITKKKVLSTVERLHGTIEGLKPRPGSSHWTRYRVDSSYDEEAWKYKEQFVERAIGSASPNTVWDLGCNTGHYSVVASRRSSYVIAMDSDADAINVLFHRAQEEQHNILPLVMDVLNPSPDQGWNQEEWPGLTSRSRPDFVLCLALIHHLAIHGNVPIKMFMAWLSALADRGVIEFVPKSDPLVQKLLRWREDRYRDYTQESFEAALQRHFRITERAAIPGSERILYAFAR